MTKRATEKDKGFAWVILVVSYLNNVIASSMFVSAAVYMVDWIEEFETTKTQVTAAGSIYGGIACFMGIFVGPLINKFGCRTVSIVGTTIAVIGCILSTFATSIWWLYITYGILIGVGHAFYFIPPILIVQYYFDKKRPLAAGLSLAGHSSGTFIMMPLLSLLVRTYGWRGAMLIHTGIIMQMFIFALLYRKPNLPDLVATKDTTNKGDIGLNTTENTPQSTEQSQKKMLQKTLSFFQRTWNCNILRNPVFIQFLISICFAQLGIDVMYKFSSIKAVVAGVDRLRASFLPSVIGLASTCARLVISFVANLKCVNRTILCGASILAQGCFVILSCFAWSFETLIVCMVLFGVCLGTHMTLSTTVTVDLLGIGNLANAQSFVSGSVSISLVSALTLTGLMVDLTGDYDLPNYIYGTLEVFAGILVLTIPLTQRDHQLVLQTGVLNSSHVMSNIPGPGFTKILKYQKKRLDDETDADKIQKCPHKATDMFRNEIYTSAQSLTSIPGS